MLIIINKGKMSSNKFIRDSIDEYAKIFNKKLYDYTIQRDDNNKPFISPTQVYFNISHSHEYTLIAMSDSEVGIDIQYHKPIDYQAVQDRFFGDSTKANTKKEFYNLWTAKEALIKRENLCFYDGLKTEVTDLGIDNIDILEKYSVAIKSDDNDYIFKFNF